MVKECCGKSIFPEVASSLPIQGGVCARWEHAGGWGRKDTSSVKLSCVQGIAAWPGIHFSLSPCSLRLGIWPHLLVCMALV